MRNLSRIIFINSANIPYSDNIYLDGNIHFIGTQGVGKSTILRAILFFYNADTQKLGIPVEKQNYTDYYFPFANSYIIYEVTTEHGAFCILSFKAMNRVCYRFIDSPYRKEFFIDENRTAYSGTDRIRAMLDQHEVEYSRIIYTYDEYRNILYGNATSTEFRRYSLMESKQYQNIPRTIQNVLLNSKLDAEFIKRTIISSLNEEEISIDLNSYKEHLKDFETRLRDISEFQKKETTEWIKEVAACYGKRVGEIAYIFCSDDKILEVNQQYLQHDYYTDIITFDYCEGNRISGDLFISLDTVRTNAEQFEQPYDRELHRVIIHGILHLCGINDKGPGEREIMEAAENKALALVSL